MQNKHYKILFWDNESNKKCTQCNRFKTNALLALVCSPLVYKWSISKLSLETVENLREGNHTWRQMIDSTPFINRYFHRSLQEYESQVEISLYIPSSRNMMQINRQQIHFSKIQHAEWIESTSELNFYQAEKNIGLNKLFFGCLHKRSDNIMVITFKLIMSKRVSLSWAET